MLVLFLFTLSFRHEMIFVLSLHFYLLSFIDGFVGSTQAAIYADLHCLFCTAHFLNCMVHLNK